MNANTNNANLISSREEAASILFGVGSIVIALASSFRFIEVAPIVFQIILFIGYSMLLAHAGLELSIDFQLSGDHRLSTHARFGGSKILNICNSIAFGLAVVLELVYSNLQFCVWLYPIAAYLFLLSAILTFVSRGCCGCCNVKLEDHQVVYNMGNFLFFIGAVALVLGSHYQQASPNEFLAFFFRRTAYFMWTGAGINYTLTDGSYLNKYKSNVSDRSGELNTTSETIV